jgi:hypothetical protein
MNPLHMRQNTLHFIFGHNSRRTDVFCIYKTLGIERSSHNMPAQFDRHNDDIVAPAGLDPLFLNWDLA